MLSPTTQQEKFSEVFLRVVATIAGYTLTKPETDDDGIDFTLSSRGGNRPRLDIQLKSTSQEIAHPATLNYPLKQKNYDLLATTQVLVPRILVLVYLPPDLPTWTNFSEKRVLLRRAAYWMSLRGLPPATQKTAVTVLVPRVQILNPSALQGIMARISAGGLP